MKQIVKTNAPNCLRQLVLDGHTKYTMLQVPCKDTVRKSLSIEQNELCAYCRRAFTSDVFIEHIDPQTSVTGIHRQLDYYNMHGVCSGKIYMNKMTGDAEIFCSVLRGNSKINLDIQSEKITNTIYFDEKFHIKSSDKNIDQELNETLNLNNDLLVEERVNTLIKLDSDITKLALENRLPKTMAYRKAISSIDKRNIPHKEFLIAELQKRIANYK